MAERKLKLILKEANKAIEINGSEGLNFKNWFRHQFQSDSEENSSNLHQHCTIEEFAVYFIAFLRKKTEMHIKAYEAEMRKDENKSQLTVDTNVDSSLNESRMTEEKEKANTSTSKSRQESPLDESSLEPMMSSLTSTPVHRSISNFNKRSFNTSTPSSPLQSSVEKSSRNISFGDFISYATPSPNRSTKKKQNQKTPDTSNASGKPKKRVVPITVSKPGEFIPNAFGCNPTFSNDNNILKLSNAEIVDKRKCAVLQARKSLKMDAREITKELDSVPKITVKPILNVIEKQTDFSSGLRPNIDFSMMHDPVTLNILSDIYSTIIDLNLTENILNDLSHLINLLNIIEQPSEKDCDLNKCDDDNDNDHFVEKLLKSATNCVYLALRVIRKHIRLLSFLDIKTLGVILDIESLAILAPDVKKTLTEIHQNKQKIVENMKSINQNYSLIDNSFSNVHYQEENDSREHFPSNFEFGAFKSQRDIFYETFKTWKAHHLNPSWSFTIQIVPKIEAIFKFSENPINMAHLAKLIISQLLISSDYNMAAPTELGVTLDAKKFTKLTQRLVTPSNFSVDYQFPGEQNFFRKFLMETRSIAFMEQIKIVIFAELMALNNSTFDILNLRRKGSESEENDISDNLSIEYIVRPEVISSMQILGKFLGLVIARPFLSSSTTNSLLNKKQLLMRNQMLPNFDVSQIVRDAYIKRKLLITIPWLVQYLVMLDGVTLQLDNYCEALHLLFDIYAKLENSDSSSFILKCCLGWLFENAAIFYKYYAYRQDDSNVLTFQTINKVRKESGSSITTNSELTSNQNSSDDITTTNDMNAMLESLLNVACPFLAEFRVSIMPAKLTTIRHASRSGRYRYINTRITDTPTSADMSALTYFASDDNKQTENINQSKLIDAFLHSQSLSMRRLIEFVIERTYSAVVKDAQMKILLPSKIAANEKVNALTPTSTVEELIIEINEIYMEAREKSELKWYSFAAKEIELRANQALEALLPIGTSLVIKNTYLFLIRKKCLLKVCNWHKQNLGALSFYCPDVAEVAAKIMRLNGKNKQTSASDLVIRQTYPCVSECLEEVQFWLHCTTQRPQLVTTETGGKIEHFCQQMVMAFSIHTMPYMLYRIICKSLIQLMQNLIEKYSQLVTSSLLTAVNDVWSVNGMKCCENENLFDSLITVPFIRFLADNSNSFEKLNLLLVSLVNRRLVTINDLNELFVPILEECWSSDVLNLITCTLRAVTSATTEITDDECIKSHSSVEALSNI